MADATPAVFRTFFPEFDSVRFPDVLVTVYLGVASKLVNGDLFADLTDFAQSNVAAHYLSLGDAERKAAARNITPGQAGVGVMSSKGADSLSASYDVGIGSEVGAGFWNLTRYGREWARLAKLFGAAPIQVGMPSPAEVSLMGAAWPGYIYG